MPNLFSPLTIKEVTFKNRIAVSPMCQYSSIDGFANDWHMVHLGCRAVGGAALVMTEASAVSPEGRISPSDLGIWKDDHINMLKKITRFIHQHQAVSGIQLAHAGRKASHREPWNGGEMLDEKEHGWHTVAPSAIPFSPHGYAPEALTLQGIQKVVSDFQAAAKRALIAGFMVIEIHAAHGYLINEFLSPLTNQRNDKYGGSFENRIRFLLEIIAAIKKVWPENYPLFLRISSTDWVEGGWTIDDSIELAGVVKSQGIDLIDCSSGGTVPGAKIPAAPGYQVPFAEAIKTKGGISTGAVGIIVTPQQAEEVITSGKADMVLLAREMLRDPYFPLRAAYELGYDITWPVQYERARRKK
jgi:2,4-dienoyl-CoA reductase-like NADH-dependent reductase (Old Yellow Enzyme family)